LIQAVVAVCARRALLVVLLATLLTGLAAQSVVSNFKINTNTEQLIAADVPWRADEIAFDAAFPQRANLVVAVVDGLTPEIADEAAEKLAAALAANTAQVKAVTRPDSGPFFDTYGLLLMPQDELARATDTLIRQQGLLGPLAADPTLHGVVQTIRLGLDAIQAGQAPAAEVAKPLGAIAASIEAVLAGKSPQVPPARLSWQTMLSDGQTSTRDTRRFLLVQPVLDYASLTPAGAVTDFIRAEAERLDLTPENGVTMRLTGQAPLADEEFATVAENAGLNNTVTLAAITLILFLALRSGKLIVAVLATTLCGLIVTAALGLLMVGQFNLISVAFAALFVGLGVDFGIQLAVRFRDERFHGRGIHGALTGAARGVGRSLLLAAVALVAGFFSFLPSEFRGVSELGLIAGAGMVIAFVASLTLLPALVALLKPGPEKSPIGSPKLGAIDRAILRHRTAVLVVTAALTLGGLPLLFQIDFDSNPMHLRSERVESVATYLDLIDDPDTSPNTIDVLAPSLTEARTLATRLAALPEVARVATLDTFLPSDQPAKLEIIRDAASLLGPVLTPTLVAPASDAATVLALKLTASVARAVAARQPGEAAQPFTRLATAFDKLANATPAQRSRADLALTTDLNRFLERLRSLFSGEELTADKLPRAIRDDWITSDGRARIEVHPKGDANDNAVLERFAEAVRAVAPHATGAPIGTTESGNTIVRAFIQAGLLSLGSIFLILVLALRRVKDVALTLGPLVIATLTTLEAAHLIGLPLNFANIIALPLMLAVGVAFHIYYVIAWRAGTVEVLASSLTRAIFFSALTTGTAFGSLCLSSHPGTASMGLLLALSLFFTLLAAFVVVPAFLGPPPAHKASGGSRRDPGSDVAENPYAETDSRRTAYGSPA
jgi:hopanoid biosynthesis associated RND transporter like protein HpnN